MSADRLRHRLRLLARRVLAKPAVSRRASAVVARVPALRRLAPVVLGAPPASASYRVSRVPPGRMFDEGRGERLPIVAFVAIGMQVGDAEQLACAIEASQMTTAGFRPIAIVDSEELRPFRLRSYVVEHVMPEALYRTVNPQDAYSDYLHDRVVAIVRGYGVNAVVPLPPGGTPALPPYLLRLAGTLTSR